MATKAYKSALLFPPELLDALNTPAKIDTTLTMPGYQPPQTVTGPGTPDPNLIQKIFAAIQPSEAIPYIPPQAAAAMTPAQRQQVESPGNIPQLALLRNLALISSLFNPALGLTGAALFGGAVRGARNKKQQTIEQALKSGMQTETLASNEAIAGARAAAAANKGPNLGTDFNAAAAELFPGIAPNDLTGPQTALVNATLQRRAVQRAAAGAQAQAQAERGVMEDTTTLGEKGWSYVNPATRKLVPSSTTVGEAIQNKFQRIPTDQVNAYISSDTIRHTIGMLGGSLVAEGVLPMDWKERLWKGPLNIAEVKLQSDPNLVTLASTLRGQASRIARAFGEVGNLSIADVRMAMAMIPRVTDTNDAVLRKMDMLDRLMSAYQEAILGSPGKARQQIDKLDEKVKQVEPNFEAADQIIGELAQSGQLTPDQTADWLRMQAGKRPKQAKVPSSFLGRVKHILGMEEQPTPAPVVAPAPATTPAPATKLTPQQEADQFIQEFFGGGR